MGSRSVPAGTPPPLAFSLLHQVARRAFVGGPSWVLKHKPVEVPVTQTELAGASDLSRNSVGAILQRLKARGLVEQRLPRHDPPRPRGAARLHRPGVSGLRRTALAGHPKSSQIYWARGRSFHGDSTAGCA